MNGRSPLYHTHTGHGFVFTIFMQSVQLHTYSYLSFLMHFSRLTSCLCSHKFILHILDHAFVIHFIRRIIITLRCFALWYYKYSSWVCTTFLQFLSRLAPSISYLRGGRGRWMKKEEKVVCRCLLISMYNTHDAYCCACTIHLQAQQFISTLKRHAIAVYGTPKNKD